MRSLSLPSTILAVVVSFAAGFGLRSFQSSLCRMQEGSRAGGTLQALARALAEARADQDAYPHSIESLKVASDGGDFSPEILRRVVYLKMGDSYVAFVGVPGVAYTRPDESVQFRFP